MSTSGCETAMYWIGSANHADVVELAAMAIEASASLPVVNLADPAFWADPYGVLAVARAQSPVCALDGGGMLAVSHEAVETVMRHPSFGTTDLLARTGIRDGPLRDWWSQVMFSQDPPEHTRIRTLVGRAFTPRQADALRPVIARICDDLVDRCQDGSDCLDGTCFAYPPSLAAATIEWDANRRDATVVVTDIIAGNGVIHVIDTVVTPGTIADLVGYAPELATLSVAVAAANLGGTLSGAGPFTVFAPVDAAFEALPAGTVEGLLADVPALTNVLTYHVVADELTSDEVVQLSAAASVQGQDIPIVVDDQGMTIGGASLVQADIKATNGVIHLIDGVLLPTAE